MHDRIVYLNEFVECICECMHICYLMEIITLTTDMLQLLLSHRVEYNSRVVRHCNRKVASQVIT
jgi:hypothetical protein